MALHSWSIIFKYAYQNMGVIIELFTIKIPKTLFVSNNQKIRYEQLYFYFNCSYYFFLHISYISMFISFDIPLLCRTPAMTVPAHYDARSATALPSVCANGDQLRIGGTPFCEDCKHCSDSTCNYIG